MGDSLKVWYIYNSSFIRGREKREYRLEVVMEEIMVMNFFRFDERYWFIDLISLVGFKKENYRLNFI